MEIQKLKIHFLKYYYILIEKINGIWHRIWNDFFLIFEIMIQSYKKYY
jgi:hypothetical protein